ncbi:MAG: hypothetical protein V1664_03505 [Candidatus Uhrbacteria bacterium]
MANKKTTKKTIKKTVKAVSSADIMKLAHAGTKESVAKLKALLDKEVDQDKKDYLFLALEEAEMMYFEPANDQEEKDFCLAKLISDNEDEWFYQTMEIDALQCRVDFARLELAIREKMFREAAKENKEMTEINRDVAQDMLTMYEDQLAEVKEELADTKAWTQTAKKMFKTKKYQELPVGFFDNYHFDDEILDEDEDDEDCCCENCCECDYEDCCGDDIDDEDLGDNEVCDCGGNCSCGGEMENIKF